MTLAILAVVVGLVLLVWSADRFVDGASATARFLGMPALLIGMVIVGFGTSAPELVVSVTSAIQDNPGIALGNAYGSNITNIALILGLTALVSPIAVHSRVLRKELPILMAVTILAGWQLQDGSITRTKALILLVVFALFMIWTIREGLLEKNDALAGEMEQELAAHEMSIQRAMFWLVVGLVVLIASSRLLVWGAVNIAQAYGVSDLIIGLTVVAVGTSLPELASSLLAVRRGEHDLALGNIIGSNLFNTLAVVGLAGTIHPMKVGPEVFSRDILVMAVLTLSLFLFGYGFRIPGKGRINRVEGTILLAAYMGYTTYLLNHAFLQQG